MGHKNKGTGGVVEATFSADLGWMGDRQPSSSDTSNSSEHPYDAYTSCQLWSSPAFMSFPAAIITALCTVVRRGQEYKGRKGGEVCESIHLDRTPPSSGRQPRERVVRDEGRD